jgi:hypothetical protein
LATGEARVGERIYGGVPAPAILAGQRSPGGPDLDRGLANQDTRYILINGRKLKSKIRAEDELSNLPAAARIHRGASSGARFSPYAD